LEQGVNVILLVEFVDDRFRFLCMLIVLFRCAAGVEAHPNRLHGQDVNEVSEGHILEVGGDLFFKADRLRLLSLPNLVGFTATA